MDIPIPEPTPYECADADLCELRERLKGISSDLYHADIMKNCLHDHFSEIAKQDPAAYAPIKRLIDARAFEQVRCLVNTIETAFIECEDRILQVSRGSNKESNSQIN